VTASAHKLQQKISAHAITQRHMRRDDEHGGKDLPQRLLKRQEFAAGVQGI
jgi:hypothetical protein